MSGVVLSTVDHADPIRDKMSDDDKKKLIKALQEIEGAKRIILEVLNQKK